MSALDQAALEWAIANPNDPRAEAVKAKALTALGKEGGYQGPDRLLQLGGELETEKKVEPRGAGTRFMRGLTTNEPPEGLAGIVGRSALPAIGGTIGAGAGAGPGSVPLAGLGAAAGESARQGLVALADMDTQARMPALDRAMQVGGRVAVQGATNAAGQGAFNGIVKLGKAAAPQVINLLTKVPKDKAAAAVEGLTVGAPTAAQAGAKLEQVTQGVGGLGAPGNLSKATGKTLDATPADFLKIAGQAQEALNNGTITPQMALWGRQALRIYQSAPRLAKQEYEINKAQIKAAMKQLDDYLEAQFPGYRAANFDYMRAKAKEAFQTWLPRNKDGSADALRTWYGATQAAQSAGAAAALPLMSPNLVLKAVETGVRAAPYTNVVAPRAAALGLAELTDLIYPTGMATANQ